MSAALERVPGRRCAICQHQERPAIESFLLDGRPQADAIRKFGVTRDSLRHHIRRHLPAALERAFDTRELVLAKTLVARVEVLHVECCDILSKAREGTVLERVAASNTVIKSYELLGRLTGKLAASGVNELFARLGVRSEDQLRQMLQVARSNVNMSVEDHILNGVEIVLAGLPERPEMREEIAAKLEKVLRPTVPALPSHTNGNVNGGH